MIDLSAGQLALVNRILSRIIPGAEALVFGSRVAGTAKKSSDLDLAIKTENKIEKAVLRNLTVAFEESDLPFRVDVVDWNNISGKFRSIIEKDFEPLIIDDVNNDTSSG